MNLDVRLNLSEYISVDITPAMGATKTIIVHCPNHSQLREKVNEAGFEDWSLGKWHYLSNTTLIIIEKVKKH